MCCVQCGRTSATELGYVRYYKDMCRSVCRIEALRNCGRWRCMPGRFDSRATCWRRRWWGWAKGSWWPAGGCRRTPHAPPHVSLPATIGTPGYPASTPRPPCSQAATPSPAGSSGTPGPALGPHRSGRCCRTPCSGGCRPSGSRRRSLQRHEPVGENWETWAAAAAELCTIEWSSHCQILFSL